MNKFITPTLYFHILIFSTFIYILLSFHFPLIVLPPFNVPFFFVLVPSLIFLLPQKLFLNIFSLFHSFLQCWGSVAFWCGSGSPDPYLLLLDPSLFFNEIKDAKKLFFSKFFLINYPQVLYIMFSLKNLIFC